MIINIVSASGAQGRSTLAAALAVVLSGQKKRVALADGCCDGGVQRLLAACPSVAYDMGDAVCGRCCASDALYRSEQGVWIMPPAADDADICADALCGVIKELSRHFDFVIYDCPAGSFSFMRDMSAAADVTVICTQGDEFHLSAASRLRRFLPQQDEKCRLVLSRYSSRSLRAGALYNIDRCIDTVGARLLGVLPEDGGAVGAIAASNIASCKNVMRAAENIAFRLCGHSVPLVKL